MGTHDIAIRFKKILSAVQFGDALFSVVRQAIACLDSEHLSSFHLSTNAMPAEHFLDIYSARYARLATGKSVGVPETLAILRIINEKIIVGGFSCERETFVIFLSETDMLAGCIGLPKEMPEKGSGDKRQQNDDIKP